jgi:hypothetical protein
MMTVSYTIKYDDRLMPSARYVDGDQKYTSALSLRPRDDNILTIHRAHCNQDPFFPASSLPTPLTPLSPLRSLRQ